MGTTIKSLDGIEVKSGGSKKHYLSGYGFVRYVDREGRVWVQVDASRSGEVWDWRERVGVSEVRFENKAI